MTAPTTPQQRPPAGALGARSSHGLVLTWSTPLGSCTSRHISVGISTGLRALVRVDYDGPRRGQGATEFAAGDLTLAGVDLTDMFAVPDKHGNCAPSTEPNLLHHALRPHLTFEQTIALAAGSDRELLACDAAELRVLSLLQAAAALPADGQHRQLALTLIRNGFGAGTPADLAAAVTAALTTR